MCGENLYVCVVVGGGGGGGAREKEERGGGGVCVCIFKDETKKRGMHTKYTQQSFVCVRVCVFNNYAIAQLDTSSNKGHYFAN